MAQEPVPQVAVAFAREQAVPQLPQLVSEVSATSQPFGSRASQLPKPGVQTEMAHEPVPHVAVAFAREQAVPQLVQLVSEVSAVSQPLGPLPSQFPKPALHDAMAQLPLPQVAVAFAREHAVPQVLQFASVVSGVSQPVESMKSQSP